MAKVWAYSRHQCLVSGGFR